MKKKLTGQRHDGVQTGSQNANSGQLFRPHWVSSAEYMPHRIEQLAKRHFYLVSALQFWPHLGCLPFSQKIRKFRLKVKWNSNFPENPFENCGLPPEVVLFFRSERNVGNFFTICTISQFQSQRKTVTGNRISNGKPHLVRVVC